MSPRVRGAGGVVEFFMVTASAGSDLDAGVVWV